jgi:SAM-dependent methyltransferase
MVRFKCNICGAANSIGDPLMKHRELLNCVNCGSSARFRGVVYAVQTEVLGGPQGAVFQTMGERKDISGIGLSDSDIYGYELARVFSYTNTFYHMEPTLDIMSKESVANYYPVDFVICSDVLEHVPPPAITAFQNLRRLVRKDGVLILTVPYLEGYESIEHYPHLYKWKTVEVGDGIYAVVNLRRGEPGRPDRVPHIECFSRPEYHGGPGETLEMRLFGEGDLRARLAYAGFLSVESIEPNISEIGYLWDYHVERPDFHGRRAKSCVMVCR